MYEYCMNEDYQIADEALCPAVCCSARCCFVSFDPINPYLLISHDPISPNPCNAFAMPKQLDHRAMVSPWPHLQSLPAIAQCLLSFLTSPAFLASPFVLLRLSPGPCGTSLQWSPLVRPQSSRSGVLMFSPEEFPDIARRHQFYCVSSSGLKTKVSQCFLLPHRSPNIQLR